MKELPKGKYLALILVGQKGPRAKAQASDISIILRRLDQTDVGKYMESYLEYVGYTAVFFTGDAEKEIYRVSGGVSRPVNRICEIAVMHEYPQQKRKIDGHRYVADQEMTQLDIMKMYESRFGGRKNPSIEGNRD